ncbi:MAG: hypothetical protein ACR2OJ_03420 [Hyphomicrobiales bacterium]
MTQLFIEHMLLLLAAFCVGGALGAILKLSLRGPAQVAVAAHGPSGAVYADDTLEAGEEFETSAAHRDGSDNELYASDELEHQPLPEKQFDQPLVSEQEQAVVEGFEELEIETEAYGLPAPRGGVADDLTQISGIGPKIQNTLNELGVFHFDQIASWGDAEIIAINEVLNFPGRIERENWVGQALELAGKSG